MAASIKNFIGVVESFSWPTYPQSVDISSESNHRLDTSEVVDIKVLTSSGSIMPRNITFTGHFSGTDKLTYFRSLSKHFRQTTRLKKLYWESDKFYLGVGIGVKRTHAMKRTNFIDYVVRYVTISDGLLGDTLRTSGTNEGNAPTFMEELRGTVSNNAVDVKVKREKLLSLAHIISPVNILFILQGPCGMAGIVKNLNN